MISIGVFTCFCSLIKAGKKVETICFIGLYKIDVSSVSFFTKGIVSFIFPKKIKMTLRIKPILRAPKMPPKILLMIPKAAKFANLVKTLPSNAMVKIIITKVAAKAANAIYSGFQDTISFRKTMSEIKSLKEKWEILVEKLTDQFAEGDVLTIDAIIYLVGVQELGQGHRSFKKDEKVIFGTLIVLFFIKS